MVVVRLLQELALTASSWLQVDMVLMYVVTFRGALVKASAGLEVVGVARKCL